MSETTRKRLRELAGDERFIPGIYNYCDYWCARCLFTARCLNYAMEAERVKEASTRGSDDTPLGDELLEILGDTLELLREMAAESGMDLDAPELDENTETDMAARLDAAVEEEEHRFRRAAEHPLAVAAEAYIDMVDRWFEAAAPAFQAREEALNAQIRMGLDEEISDSIARGLTDAVAVIRWYQFFISAKLQNALHSADESSLLPAETQSHADGVAKIALLAIDRSMDAWETLARFFPQHETEALEILVHLSQLRRNVEAEFPRARAFVRPGFDEPEMW